PVFELSTQNWPRVTIATLPDRQRAPEGRLPTGRPERPSRHREAETIPLTNGRPEIHPQVPRWAARVPCAVHSHRCERGRQFRRHRGRKFRRQVQNWAAFPPHSGSAGVAVAVQTWSATAAVFLPCPPTPIRLAGHLARC